MKVRLEDYSIEASHACYEDEWRAQEDSKFLMLIGREHHPEDGLQTVTGTPKALRKKRDSESVLSHRQSVDQKTGCIPLSATTLTQCHCLSGGCRIRRHTHIVRLSRAAMFHAGYMADFAPIDRMLFVYQARIGEIIRAEGQQAPKLFVNVTRHRRCADEHVLSPTS